MPSDTSLASETIVSRLQRHADRLKEKVAFTDGRRTLTYGQLHDLASAHATAILDAGEEDCAVLVAFPSGLEFVIAFFGCLIARAIPIPIPPPTVAQATARVCSIVADSGVRSGWVSRLDGDAVARWSRRHGLQVAWSALDTGGNEVPPARALPTLRSQHPAFVQYTSGSIAQPHGVVVTHGNIMDNMRRLTAAFDTTERDVGVCWLPPYHDMGLVGTILHTVYLGASSVLLSPVAFLRQPLTWLQTIDRYRATITSTSSFALGYTAERVTREQPHTLDLSSLRVMPVGGEPVRPSAIDAFERLFVAAGAPIGAIRPCYGLAESTLIVSGRNANARPTIVESATCGGGGIVSCGMPLVELRILDPHKHAAAAEGTVGEICIHGESVTDYRWGRFGAGPCDPSEWLQIDGTRYRRTSDFGFLHRGELFVTGRREGLLIVDSRSLHAEDLEATALDCHPALRGGAALAFADRIGDDERVVLIAETAAPCAVGKTSEIRACVTRAVAAAHGVRLYRVEVVAPRTLRRTSSGKICRTMHGLMESSR
jgi:acyl-CoA synthetase (AMP-forming)/AMP-acid ligase II